MSPKFLYSLLTIFIALVWLANGLLCKILNFVPRHQEIIGSILGDEYARPLTIVIGLGELVLGLLILIRYKSKVLAIIQIFLVITMNVLEFFLQPGLLLWGPFNSLFALGFILIVYYHEFILGKKLESPSQLISK